MKTNDEIQMRMLEVLAEHHRQNPSAIGKEFLRVWPYKKKVMLVFQARRDQQRAKARDALLQSKKHTIKASARYPQLRDKLKPSPSRGPGRKTVLVHDAYVATIFEKGQPQ